MTMGHDDGATKGCRFFIIQLANERPSFAEDEFLVQELARRRGLQAFLYARYVGVT